MSRVRRRLWLFVMTIGGGLLASWLVVGGLAYAAEPAPVVTFTDIGAPPFACGSRPDVSSLSVPEGTEIVIGNRIGVSARVVVNGQTVLSVASGEGAALTLAPGQYAIRLVPECRGLLKQSPVTVTVTADSQPPSPPGVPTEPPEPSEPPEMPASPDAPDEQTDAGPSSPPSPTSEVSSGTPPAARPGGAVGSPDGATGGRPIVRTSSVPSATSPDASPSPSASRPTAVQPGSGIISASPMALEGQDHPKGLRLLATIAAICVLGVTAAIIRAIVRLSP